MPDDSGQAASLHNHIRKPRLRLALMLLRWVPPGTEPPLQGLSPAILGTQLPEHTDLWGHTQITFKPEHIGSKSKLRNLGMGHIPLQGVSNADESLGSSHLCSLLSRTSVKPCLDPFFSHYIKTSEAGESVKKRDLYRFKA